MAQQVKITPNLICASIMCMGVESFTFEMCSHYFTQAGLKLL